MGISGRDLDTINKAHQAGMIFEPGDTTDSQHATLTVRLGQLNAQTPDAKNIFMSVLKGIARTRNTTFTYHLELENGTIPEFVIRSVEELQGVGLRLVVTHEGTCSHTENTQLNSRLQQALINSAVGGFLWHPLDHVFVSARPDRAVTQALAS